MPHLQKIPFLYSTSKLQLKYELSHFSHIQLFATLWIRARQDYGLWNSLPLEFSRQEYWSGLPFPPPGDLPKSGLLHCRQILYHLSQQGSPKPGQMWGKPDLLVILLRLRFRGEECLHPTLPAHHSLPLSLHLPSCKGAAAMLTLCTSSSCGQNESFL